MSRPGFLGKTTRHQLHRDGNRDANRALWVIATGRLRWDAAPSRLHDPADRRGQDRAEIIRCLERFIAREVYRVLVPAVPASTGTPAVRCGGPG